MVTAGGLPPLPGAWPAAGARLRTARPYLPGPEPPAPRRVRVYAPQSPGERGAERRRSAASPGEALPHTPPTPAPEAAARDPRQGAGPGGQGKVTHWESAAARGAHRLPAPQPNARSALRGPLRERGASRPPLRREPPPLPPPRISWQEANSGQDFTSQPPLLLSRGRAPGPSRPTRHAPGPTGCSTGRERGGPESGSTYPESSGGGPGRGRHSWVRVSPLRPSPPALPHPISVVPAARLIPPCRRHAQEVHLPSPRTADRRKESGTAGEAVNI